MMGSASRAGSPKAAGHGLRQQMLALPLANQSVAIPTGLFAIAALLAMGLPLLVAASRRQLTCSWCSHACSIVETLAGVVPCFQEKGRSIFA